jgi:hypothetical protein
MRTAGDYHGTINGYSWHGCREECCVAANADHQRAMTEQRAQREVPPHVHGTESGYANYRCRCEPCCEAHSAKQAMYRERRKQRA